MQADARSGRIIVFRQESGALHFFAGEDHAGALRWSTNDVDAMELPAVHDASAIVQRHGGTMRIHIDQNSWKS